ncbi:MAG: sigma-E factor negative regulatory protein [Proteobacteria bacterium]|nr:sigma-E factor negative regulatory protein [Pseudomonadota bacterium]
MSEQIREQISAFLDGELPDSETELLLKRLSRDEELRAVFGRFAFAGDVLRQPGCTLRSRSLVSVVNRRIDGEPQAMPHGMGVALVRRWWRPVVGAAVAASVAVVAVVSVERHSSVPLAPLTAARVPMAAPHPSGPAPMPLLASVPASRAGGAHEALSYTVPVVSGEHLAVLPPTRLTGYVLAHSKYSSLLGQRNVLSGLMADQPEQNALPEPGDNGRPPATGADNP